MADLEAENRSEIEIELQGIPDPVEAKPEKAFVNAIGGVNQAKILFSNHQQSLANHPQISQTGSQKQAAQSDRFRQMTFVNMKASTFLVGERRFNLETTAIIFAGLIAIVNGWSPHRVVHHSDYSTNPPGSNSARRSG
jgi:hypothetical protein